MYLIGLTELVRQENAYRTLCTDLAQGQSQEWQVLRSARPVLLASLAQDWHAPILYLTARGKRVHNVAEQLPVWLADSERIQRFAEPTPMFYDRLPWDNSVIRERIETLQTLLFPSAKKPAPIVISSARALMQRTMPVEQFRQRSTVLRVGERVQLSQMINQWVQLGYESVTMVTETGTFSRRGGLVDVFPMSAPLPLRIEFLGDEIDTLRSFDPATQRTVERLQEIVLTPAREALPDAMPAIAERLGLWFSTEHFENFSQDYDALRSGQVFPYLEHYLPYVYHESACLLDYLPANTLIVIEDWDDLADAVQELAEQAATNRQNNLSTQQIPDDYPLPYVEWESLEARLRQRLTLNLGANPSEENPSRLFRPSERFGGQLRLTLQGIRARRETHERVVVVSHQIPRLEHLWYDQDASGMLPKQQELLSPPEGIVFVEGELAEGWVLAGELNTLHLISDAEIFGWSRPEPRRRKSAKRGAHKLPESDYSDWNEGDYVVHVDYGIGRFKGMGKRLVEGIEREFLLVEYAEGALFVPIHQADRLTRYIGADDAPPKLNVMGKQESWLKAKEKARKNAVEEAKELLQIYAHRAATQGHAYMPDDVMQYELEASFPYVETDDQLRVIREIKADMETFMPMDRLVCGDVGYGKTEVALRAAFKAVMDGKQVAVLVPTTVLADQHFKTFSRRMEQFPVNVEMLSRFRTKAEQTQALNRLASGEIDIIIGTHRILSNDIIMPKLGLIIIDEEQRFGVKHKEHFKKLRANVDVLTLTATPIPRTLYMSLAGVRDISMLQTPPEDRLPVITHVGGFDGKLARQAILREMDRGGQVFVIHNRIKSLESLRDKLQLLIPEATMVIAHGQMGGKQLENVISEFSKGNYDILLATSILENGIDMPNVNTLIVDRADWFGLAQLYQIRGRVGRGATQAYAYFFHSGGKRLSDDAKARLETLAEHTDLGSGLQISMRDLELRGAGDILSTKQTGHVAVVGLQLYTQLLQQAVSELKGESLAPSSVTQERMVIDLPLVAYIPNDWIPEMALRLQLYRRIGNLRTLEEVDAMEQELRDRFGVLPMAVDGLLYQIRVKLLATAINASSISKPREHILIKVGWLMAVERDRLARQLGSDIEVSRVAVEMRFNEKDGDLWRLRLLDILSALRAGLPEQVGMGA